jgi:hypothetical protein
LIAASKWDSIGASRHPIAAYNIVVNPETIEFAKKLAEGARAKAFENYLRLLTIRRAAAEQERAQAPSR